MKVGLNFMGAEGLFGGQLTPVLELASKADAQVVASETYTISKVTQAPRFSLASGTYSNAQTVTLSDATPGATIYYSIGGTARVKYTKAIQVAATEWIQASATAPGYASSTSVTAAYTISKTAAAPTFSVPAGTYSAKQTVKLTDATPGAVIYYTINGTKPSTSSTKYTAAISIAKTETVKAIAVAAGYTTSPIASKSYAISQAKTVATPKFSVASGAYKSAQTVTLSDATAGAVIYYSIHGAAAIKYSSAIKVKASETIAAFAQASGYTKSATFTVSYVIK